MEQEGERMTCSMTLYELEKKAREIDLKSAVIYQDLYALTDMTHFEYVTRL